MSESAFDGDDHRFRYIPYHGKHPRRKSRRRCVDLGCHTRHELLHTPGLCARIVVAIPLQKVDCAPDAKACAKCDHEGPKYGYCAVEKSHIDF